MRYPDCITLEIKVQARPLLNAAMVGDSRCVMSRGFHIFAAKLRVVQCPHRVVAIME